METAQRKWFGRHRYFISSVKNFIFSTQLISFACNTKYKLPNENKDADWIKYNHDRIFSFSVLTHGVRSTLSKAPLLPSKKLDDKKMIMHNINKCSKIEALIFFLKWMINRGAHLEMDKVTNLDITEFKIQFEDLTSVSVDGELYKVHDVHGKLLPGYINFIGHTE